MAIATQVAKPLSRTITNVNDVIDAVYFPNP